MPSRRCWRSPRRAPATSVGRPVRPIAAALWLRPSDAPPRSSCHNAATTEGSLLLILDMWPHVLAAAQIIWINVILSGDNAVVIALACRGLPSKQRKWWMILGAGA